MLKHVTMLMLILGCFTLSTPPFVHGAGEPETPWKAKSQTTWRGDDWKTVRTTFEPASTRTITRDGGTTTTSERVFVISDPHVGSNGDMGVTIGETRREIVTQKRQMVEVTTFDIYEDQVRTYKEYSILRSIALGAGIGTGAGLILVATAPEVEIFDENEWARYLAGGVGVGLVILGVVGTHNAMTVESTTESRSIDTGKTRNEESVKGTSRDVIEERVAYDGPARNLPVRVNGSTLRSNSAGEVRLPSTPDDWAPTRAELRDRAKDFRLIREVRPQYRDAVLTSAMRVAEPHVVAFTVVTAVQGAPGTEVVNDSERIRLSGLRLTEDDIRSVARDYVRDEVEDDLVDVRFQVVDAISGDPISGTEVSVRSDAPAKRQLAGRYFTGDLSNYAARQIDDYLAGEYTRKLSSGTIDVTALNGSRLDIQVRHESYGRVAGQVEIQGPMEVIAHLIEDGTRLESDRAAALERIEAHAMR